jgi:sensor c-di-GMP phosphodiesterase-like protein
MRPCLPYFFLLILAGAVLGVAYGTMPPSPVVHSVDVAVQTHGNVLFPALFGAASGVLLCLLIYRWTSGAPGVRRRLNRAMRRGHIHVVYQPLVEMSSGRTVGVEALARWTHETLGAIPPETFFQWAESTGLGRKLTRHIVRAALSDLQIQLREPGGFYGSINVTPRDIEDLSFVEFMLKETRAFGIEPDRIVLEITESLAFVVEDPRALISQYLRAGFRVVIDDFGTGYANLSNLLTWGVSGLKLDRTLIRWVSANDWAAPVLDSVFEMTRRLNIYVLVEGIETEDQARYVLERAPEATGQGWLYGRPCPAELLGASAAPPPAPKPATLVAVSFCPAARAAAADRAASTGHAVG